MTLVITTTQRNLLEKAVDGRIVQLKKVQTFLKEQFPETHEELVSVVRRYEVILELLNKP